MAVMTTWIGSEPTPLLHSVWLWDVAKCRKCSTHRYGSRIVKLRVPNRWVKRSMLTKEVGVVRVRLLEGEELVHVKIGRARDSATWPIRRRRTLELLQLPPLLPDHVVGYVIVHHCRVHLLSVYLGLWKVIAYWMPLRQAEMRDVYIRSSITSRWSLCSVRHFDFQICIGELWVLGANFLTSFLFCFFNVFFMALISVIVE